jgi:hypothetical protein
MPQESFFFSTGKVPLQRIRRESPDAPNLDPAEFEEMAQDEALFHAKILGDFFSSEEAAHLPVSGTGLAGNETRIAYLKYQTRILMSTEIRIPFGHQHPFPLHLAFQISFQILSGTAGN